jgi:hypothetical protein
MRITIVRMQFFHERVKRIMDDYGRDLILEHFPRFEALFTRMEGANNAISASRETREQRINIYKSLAEHHVPMLYEFHQQILTSEPLMLAHKKRTILKRRGAEILAVVLALVVIALAYIVLRR